MNNFGNWFRRFSANMAAGLRRFMIGRYGTDKLNTAILLAGLILCLLGMFMPPPVNLLFAVLSYGLMIWSVLRSFSRNIYKRYRENQKYLAFMERLKDRNHRYFACPKCRQSVRVPRGKGKIAITCPRCKEKFIRKT